MIRTRTLVGTGALVLLASTSLSLVARAQVPDPAATLEWPSAFPGAFVKLESACLFEPGEPDLLVLAGDELVLVRAPMSCPRMLGVATGVADFVVLPAIAGTSTVAITTAAGLTLSTLTTDSDPSLEFIDVALGGDWKDATRLAAAQSADGQLIVATRGVDILRAHCDASNTLTELQPLSTHGASVTHLAAGDVDKTREGAELAYVAADRLYFVDEGEQTFFGPYHIALGYIDISRVPGGADGGADGGVDSFALIARFDYGGGEIGVVMCEVANGVVSNAIFGGELEVADICYASAGNDGRSDLIVSSSTSPVVVVLHGTPQSGSPLPFELRQPPEWSVIDLAESSLPHPPHAPKLACADFDLDGDGDLVFADDHLDARYLSFMRGFASIETAVSVRSDPAGLIKFPGGFPLQGGAESLEVGLTVDVPHPAHFVEGPPNRIRVRVWEQSAEFAETSVLPQLWAQEFVPVVNGVAQVSISERPVANSSGEETVLHFEIVSQLVDTSNQVIRRGGATNWVGAAAQTPLDQYMCAYPDEYTPPELNCETYGGSPIVTTINRRTIIRPTLITPSQP